MGQHLNNINNNNNNNNNNTPANTEVLCSVGVAI